MTQPAGPHGIGMLPVVAFAGNRTDRRGTPVEEARFPNSKMSSVRRRISAFLLREAPSAVVGAAAAGGDLLVLEEALTIGIDAHLVLPLTVQAFREASVVDRGDAWAASFDRVVTSLPPSRLQSAGTTAPTMHVFKQGNEAILSYARDLAEGATVLALAICAPPGSHPPRVTDHFAELARLQDIQVTHIDPLDA